MTSNSPIDPLILEQAADWLLRLREDGDAEAAADFVRWIEASPLNRQAFDSVEEAWSLAGGIELKGSMRGLLPVPAHRTHEPSELVLPMQQHRSVLKRSAIAATIMLAFVAAAVISMLAWPTTPQPHVERIVTERSQHQAASLPDGSRVELGGLSAVSVRYSSESRMVVVDSGEAYYEVQKDAARPFIVQAGPVTVTAVGTKFTVRREGEAVSVLVTEGMVEVSADPSLRAKSGGETRTYGLKLRASAGERIRFDRGELSQAVERLRPEVATSWRFGRLEFVDEPLRLVVSGVNRYSGREILIDDPAIGELRFTGTVFENEVPSWLKAVETVFGLRVVELDKRRVLISRAKPMQGAPK